MAHASSARAVILFLLLAGPCLASTLTYDIDFTADPSDIAPTSGVFTYNTVTGFSNFTVVWDSITFNLTSSANAPNTPGLTGCNLESSDNAAFGFAIMSEAVTGCPTTPTYEWEGSNSGPSSSAAFSFVLEPTAGEDDITGITTGAGDETGAVGIWSIVPQAAPEPGSLSLMLVAALAIFATRSWRAKWGRISSCARFVTAHGADEIGAQVANLPHFPN